MIGHKALEKSDNKTTIPKHILTNVRAEGGAPGSLPAASPPRWMDDDWWQLRGRWPSTTPLAQEEEDGGGGL